MNLGRAFALALLVFEILMLLSQLLFVCFIIRGPLHVLFNYYLSQIEVRGVLFAV